MKSTKIAIYLKCLTKCLNLTLNFTTCSFIVNVPLVFTDIRWCQFCVIFTSISILRECWKSRKIDDRPELSHFKNWYSINPISLDASIFGFTLVRWDSTNFFMLCLFIFSLHKVIPIYIIIKGVTEIHLTSRPRPEAGQGPRKSNYVALRIVFREHSIKVALTMQKGGLV